MTENGTAVIRLRGVASRVLHPLRRRRALARLRRRPKVASVLVVCHGNICRSPFAAALLARMLPRLRIESAGFVGPGRPAPPEAITEAARYGVDLSAHRSQLITADRVRTAELIVVMDVAQRREIRDRFGRAESHLLLLGDLDPLSIDARTIRDPVNQPPAVFEASYARIERCARELRHALHDSTG